MPLTTYIYSVLFLGISYREHPTLTLHTVPPDAPVKLQIPHYGAMEMHASLLAASPVRTLLTGLASVSTGLNLT
jgi:hypothetical protein